MHKNMVNVFMIHGAFGHPEENWFPWLKFELEKQGHKVFTPKFPTPERQSLKNWMIVFEEYSKFIDKNSIFIGHSLGPAFILNIIENLDIKVKAAFFVAGFTGLLGKEIFDSINKTITDKNFDWDRIRKHCDEFYIFHSDNDPYVPINKAKYLALNLKTEITEIYGAGHFNEAAGYKTFPELLADIKLALRQEKLIIKNRDNQKIVGLRSQPDKKADNHLAAILVHGFEVTKREGGMFDQMADMLNNEGVVAYRFDFSGCGESEGDYSETTLTKLKEELNTIISYVKEREKIKGENIIIIAQSFGTSVTLALNPNVKAIALLGSIAHPTDVLGRLFEKGFNPGGVSKRNRSSGRTTIINSQFWKDCDSYNLIDNVCRIKCPILLICGSEDDKVPKSESEELYSNAPQPRKMGVVKGADHGYTKCRNELLSTLQEWIRSL